MSRNFGYLRVNTGCSNRDILFKNFNPREIQAENSSYVASFAERIGQIKNTLDSGGRVIAIGTTTMRVLESDEFLKNGSIRAFEKDINTFIKPGHKFKVCSGLLTNFHQPKSTLFVLVNAFVGINQSKALYKEAIKKKYRLFSYGDCCLLFP